MRLAVLLSFLPLVACAPPAELNLDHLSTMESQTRGVVLMDDGQKGHGAMGITTCQFDTLNGWIISDHDMPTAAEEVTDTWRGSVVGVSEEGAHKVMRHAGDVEVSGVRDARFLPSGELVVFRAVDAGCEVSWTDSEAAAVVDGAVCEGSGSARAVVASTGEVVASADGEVVKLSPDDLQGFDDLADFVVYDRHTDLLYLAMEGDREVRGVTLDGERVWHTVLDGPVTAMQWMGGRGKVVAMIDDPDGGRMVVIDGPSGEVEQEQPTPSADVELSVSEDGTTLAVVTGEEVYFFDVYTDDEEPKERHTYGAERRQPVFED